jgi:hypothetical protein
VKSLLKKFVPKSLVEAVINDEADYRSAIEKDIEFVLVKFNDDNAIALRQAISDAVDIAIENGAIVEDIVSSLVVLTYGFLDDETNSKGKGHELSTLLLEKFGSKIAIVYGNSPCLVGNHGSSNRMTFGSLIPNFWEHLVKLSTVTPGSKECI